MKILITGGAGFIGSHLVDRMISNCADERKEIVVLDNLSTGRLDYIEKYLDVEFFRFYRVNIVSDDIRRYFEGVDEVCHLAAHPDVRIGHRTPATNFDDIKATYNVMEAMRSSMDKDQDKKIIFTSTSTVYGEAKRMPTGEDYGPLVPISLYGASKLACEAIISAYAHTFDIKAWIYRLANVVGGRSTHGVIHDFIIKLSTSKKLHILGDGRQNKSYIHVDDCIDGMFFGLKASEDVNIFNIGNKDQISVKRIAEVVSEEMIASELIKEMPEFVFTGGKRGWKGDVPLMLLDISKIERMGWTPRYSSEEAVRIATREYLLRMRSEHFYPGELLSR